jgi:hypothetical protein
LSYINEKVEFLHGDCLLEMPKLPENSVDSIITDPPYGLKFMGKTWDHGIPGELFWREALRVAKPGAFLLAFGGTRTFHRLACAIEDAGWELRDTIMWVYGSGFPKSHDVSKAIDREAGAEREVVGENPYNSKRPNPLISDICGQAGWPNNITSPATDAAKEWDGWGTALKPAWEPIIVARKPPQGTVAQNVLRYRTGGMNIDGCRVGTEEMAKSSSNGIKISENRSMSGANFQREIIGSAQGRWPANVILTIPEDVFILKDDVTPEQLIKLAEWMNENAKH